MFGDNNSTDELMVSTVVYPGKVLPIRLYALIDSLRRVGEFNGLLMSRQCGPA